MNEQRVQSEETKPKKTVSIWKDSPGSAAKRIIKLCFVHRWKLAIATVIIGLLALGTYGTQSVLSQSKKAKLAVQETAELSQRLEQTLLVLGDAFKNAKLVESANFTVPSKQVLIYARDNIDGMELDDAGKDALLTMIVDGLVSLQEYLSAIETAKIQVEMNVAQSGKSQALPTYRALNRLAKCFELAGLRTDAYEQRSAAERRIQAALGKNNHPELIRAGFELAVLLSKMHDFSGARPLLVRSVSQLTELHGESHPDVLESLGYLASNATKQEKFSEALKFRKQIFDIRRKAHGIEEFKTLQALHNLVVLYFENDEEEKGVQLALDHVEASKTQNGEGHLSTIRLMQNLAFAYEKAGRIDLSVDLRKQIDEYNLATFGKEHPESVVSACRLAEAYMNQGESKRVDEILQTRLTMDAEQLAAGPLGVFYHVHEIGLWLEDVGKFDESVFVFRKLVDAQKRRRGSDNLITLSTVENLTIVCSKAGRAVEVLELALNNFEAVKAKVGTMHDVSSSVGANTRYVICMALIEVEAMIADGNFQYARMQLDAMHRYDGRFLNYWQREVMMPHVEVLLQLEEYELADALAERWHELIEQGAPDEPITDPAAIRRELRMNANAWVVKSICELELGKFKLAEQSAKKALKAKDISQVDQNRCRCVLAVCMARQDKIDEAEKQAVSAFEAIESQVDVLPKTLSVHMPFACRCLIKIYEQAGKHDDAEKWKKRLLEIQQLIKSRRTISV